MEVLLTHVSAATSRVWKRKGSASPMRESSGGQSGTVRNGTQTFPEPLFYQAVGWNGSEGSSD